MSSLNSDCERGFIGSFASLFRRRGHVTFLVSISTRIAGYSSCYCSDLRQAMYRHTIAVCLFVSDVTYS